MEKTIIQRYLRWATPWLLLLVLAAFACASPTDSALDTPPATDPPLSSGHQLARPAQTDPTFIPASPTPQEPSATPTPTLPPPTATATPSPVPTHTPSPTPTPTPVLRQLTTDGCCTGPFWSPDSQKVLFIDQPAPDAPLGIYGVDTTNPAATPQLLTGRIAVYTADLSFQVEYGGGETVIERLDGPLAETTAEQWTVPAGGRPVSVSPGQTRIAWQVSDDNLPFERRTTQVWVANLDGTDAEPVVTLPRGGFSGWVSDDVLLLSGRESLESRETVVYTLSLFDRTRVELVRAERPRGLLLSPDGSWLAYFVSLSDERVQNGLWLVRTDGSERFQLDRQFFGAYQWRDARRLVIIPFQPEAVYHELWELDVETGQTRRLTDPGVTPFKIANGDWVVSPDGRHVAFVENSDRNIWMLTLAQ